MINVLVTLEVKSFTLLAAFESKAVQIMHTHGGSMIGAFVSQKNENGSGQEIHLLEFPSLAAFDDYRSDALLLEYADLRNKAIDSTAVIISDELKEYT